ncbi:MAG TPA: hypothetical protein PKC44_16030 [Agitococcus sp.]|nr:hypothetical protein [Agitococcus sp.]
MSLVAQIGKEWKEYDKLQQCILIFSLSLLVIVEFVGFVIF